MIPRIIKAIIEVISRETAWFKIRKQFNKNFGHVRPNKFKGAQA